MHLPGMAYAERILHPVATIMHMPQTLKRTFAKVHVVPEEHREQIWVALLLVALAVITLFISVPVMR
ncbi:MAG: hypothetical protein N3C12_07840 [Candidatus Binatia bacterium]|nr:hypothetical protein [Candidatus Binatia bacterium]